MQTDRDAQIVSWLAPIGAASAEHVMARFGMGRSWAYARLSRLVRGGLLELFDVPLLLAELCAPKAILALEI